MSDRGIQPNRLLRRIMLGVLLGLLGLSTAIADDGREKMVSDAVATFAAQDREAPPPPGGVVFAGSSSIERWNLASWFPDLHAVNRGIGGSHITDLGVHLDQLVLRYRPRVVVIYAGDNDLADGGTPAQIEADFRSIVARVRGALPDTRIVYIAVKPSLARWNLIGEIHDANNRMRRTCQGTRWLTFVDVETPMLGPDGRPRPELFAGDGLHLSTAGYRLWTSLVTPLVEAGSN